MADRFYPQTQTVSPGNAAVINTAGPLVTRIKLVATSAALTGALSRSELFTVQIGEKIAGRADMTLAELFDRADGAEADNVGGYVWRLPRPVDPDTETITVTSKSTNTLTYAVVFLND